MGRHNQLSNPELLKLQNLSAFGAISIESIEFLVIHGEEIELSNDSVLFHTGDTADEFHIVLEGSISLYQKRGDKLNLIRDFLPGDQIGVTAMISLNKRQGEGIAKCKSKILKIKTSIFNELYLLNKQDFILLVMNMFRDMARGLKTERNNH
ncbi:MAG: cyclic nucleotide-binding domain-containing protein [Motiliproteus sp.]